MKLIKLTRVFISAGAFSAVAASLCCITPVIALLVGSSSIIVGFSWMETARPYLIGLSVAVLLFAWYIKLKPAKANDMDCNCDIPHRSSFLQSKTFLGIITVFAVLMITFPFYAKIFYPKTKVQSSMAINVNTYQKVKLNIQGMTCQGCEEHVNTALSKVNGVIDYKTSYATKKSLVTFDLSKVNVTTLTNTINKTGYKVTSYQFIKDAVMQVSFYEAPLVCPFYPSIGCGSKSKFMLADLEKNNNIEGAWLNRKGTTVAVKWKDNMIRKYNLR